MFFILALVVIPLVAGYIANFVVGKGKGFLPWEMFVAGIIGSFVGGAIGNLVAGSSLERASSVAMALRSIPRA